MSVRTVTPPSCQRGDFAAARTASGRQSAKKAATSSGTDPLRRQEGPDEGSSTRRSSATAWLAAAGRAAGGPRRSSGSMPCPPSRPLTCPRPPCAGPRRTAPGAASGRRGPRAPARTGAAEQERWQRGSHSRQADAAHPRQRMQQASEAAAGSAGPHHRVEDRDQAAGRQQPAQVVRHRGHGARHVVEYVGCLRRLRAQLLGAWAAGGWLEQAQGALGSSGARKSVRLCLYRLPVRWPAACLPDLKPGAPRAARASPRVPGVLTWRAQLPQPARG